MFVTNEVSYATEEKQQGLLIKPSNLTRWGTDNVRAPGFCSILSLFDWIEPPPVWRNAQVSITLFLFVELSWAGLGVSEVVFREGMYRHHECKRTFNIM